MARNIIYNYLKACVDFDNSFFVGNALIACLPNPVYNLIGGQDDGEG